LTVTTDQAERNKGLTVRLTEDNFVEHSEGAKPLFVDFWASWCGPCRMMDPVVEKLAEKYSGKMVFGRVNVDEEMNLSSRYEVLSIPTFMLFRKGQPTDAVIGAVGEVALEQFIRRTLNGHTG
jgi:thioredoxin 1